MMNNVVIGAGISGIVMAERIASQSNEPVIIFEKRKNIGGNCFDYKDNTGIFIQQYGPHIFHTDRKMVWEYVSQFTDWCSYRHKVLGLIDGKYVPIPFNLESLHALLPGELAARIEKKLVEYFGYNRKIPILTLLKVHDTDIKHLADFIYEKVYLHYSKKQWGLKPEEMDASVTARVPVNISRDNDYFDDCYQGIPLAGYTQLCKSIIRHNRIKIRTNMDYQNMKGKLKYARLFYTGPIDEYFNYKYGKLDYRHLQIRFKKIKTENYQPTAVVNYPNDYRFTRITEYKKLNKQTSPWTTIGIEYPGKKGFLGWPLLDDKNREKFQKYWKKAFQLREDNIYFLGRLAEYKYYDMDDAIANALKRYEIIFKR